MLVNVAQEPMSGLVDTQYGVPQSLLMMAHPRSCASCRQGRTDTNQAAMPTWLASEVNPVGTETTWAERD